MQNRYIADIGDYVKFAELRAIARDRVVGLAWYLFPDENHNGDGAHREYLQRPHEWKHFDPELFEVLLKIEKANERSVHAIETAGLLPSAVFASDPVPCEARPYTLRPLERSKWLEGVKAKLQHCNFVFLDPDNGIAPMGLRLTQRRAGKSVTVGEIKPLQEGGRPIVIYHHQTRCPGGHTVEINNLVTRLQDSGLQVSGALRATPWSPRFFFILNGDNELEERAKTIEEYWRGRITWHPQLRT
jgi:hypothetical protein